MINNGITPENFNKNSRLNVTETNDDFGNYEGQNDSLLTLIHPELDMLSKNWQAALKDHALLLLPCEFNSQLPHEGGAFYTSSTIENSRSHYKNAWPPILYALSLWLNAEEFKHENASIAKELQDKFYLIFGICTEAICNQRTLENLENFITCLKSLYTILDSSLARQMLMKNCILAVETLNIMHKLLLTNDSIEVQQTIMNIVKQIVKAAQEDLKIKNANTINDKSLGSSTAADVACLGDGGQDGVLEYDKSIVFATLEVCMCLIVRQIPDMNPTPLVSSTRKLHSNCLNHNVIATTLNIMAQLPNLCSPNGGVQILPTIAYLTTNVLKELGETNSSNEAPKNKVSILAALDAFHVLCKHPFGYHKISESKWRSLLQSTIAKLIDISKTGDEGKKLNEITMLSVITVFTLHAPPGVMFVQNILYPCINYCTQCFGSENILVKTKCIQFLKAVFQLEDKYIATGYIQALAPRLMELLYVEIPNNMLESNLIMLCEAISAIECLVQIAQPKHRIQMLSLLVPSLINFLMDTELTKYDSTISKSRSKLHEFSLQCLLKIGPVYPQEFKVIMSQNNKLKTKLEHTIKTTKSQQQFNSGNHIPQSITKSIQPSIKLKTDFTNFS